MASFKLAALMVIAAVAFSESTNVTAEPAPTSAEEAAKQAVEKLHPYAIAPVKVVAAATAAASFEKEQGQSGNDLLEVAESAAKTVLENITGITNQEKVNFMAGAVGAVAVTLPNITKQEAADQTKETLDGFAQEVYSDDPKAAIAAVGAAGGSIIAATGRLPTQSHAAAENVTEAAKEAGADTSSAEATAAEDAKVTGKSAVEKAENSTTAETSAVTDAAASANSSSLAGVRAIADAAASAANSSAAGVEKVVDDAAESLTKDGIKSPNAEDKSGGIPAWLWILIALAILACLAGGYMLLCQGPSKDKKKKTKTNKTAAKDLATGDVEAAPLIKGEQGAPTASASVYSAPVAGAAAGGVAAGSVAQGTVLSQGSPMYPTSGRGFTLPQGSPVAGSNMVMLPQAAPASASGTFAAASPVMVQSVQGGQPPMMMSGQVQYTGQPVAMMPGQAQYMGQPAMMMPGAQAPMGAQMSGAGGSTAADLFARLDANGDGQLSPQEFAQLAAMRR